MSSDRKKENPEYLTKLTYNELINKYQTAPDGTDTTYLHAIVNLFSTIEKHPDEKPHIESHIQLLLQKSDYSDPKPYIILAYAHKYNIGAAKNSNMTVTYLEEASNKGSIYAKKILGLTYINREATPENLKKSKDFCLEVIASPDYKNDMEVYLTLGRIYHTYKIKKHKEEEKALEYYLKAEELACGNAEFEMEIWLRIGDYHKMLLHKEYESKQNKTLRFDKEGLNYKNAKKYLTKAYKSGSKVAGYVLSHIVIESNEDKSVFEIVARDAHTMIERDIGYLKRLDKADHIENPYLIKLCKSVCVNMASAYVQGTRINKDLKKAALYYYYTSFFADKLSEFREGIERFYIANRSEPAVCYYYALYAANISSTINNGLPTPADIFVDLLKKSPKALFELWSQSLAEPAAKHITERLIEIMYTAFNKIKKSNDEYIDKIRFLLAEKLYLSENPNLVKESYRHFFDLSPKNLSTEENYQAGLHLYDLDILNLQHADDKRSFNQFMHELEEKSYKKFIYNVFSAPQKKALQIKGNITDRVYLHLKDAALNGHQKAKEFMVKVACDRIVKKFTDSKKETTITTDKYNELVKLKKISFPNTLEEFMTYIESLITGAKNETISIDADDAREEYINKKIARVKEIFSELEQKHPDYHHSNDSPELASLRDFLKTPPGLAYEDCERYLEDLSKEINALHHKANPELKNILDEMRRVINENPDSNLSATAGLFRRQ